MVRCIWLHQLPNGYSLVIVVSVPATKISDASVQALSAEHFRTEELFLEKVNTTQKSAVCAVLESFTWSQHVLYIQSIALQ